ncbi:DUF1326 domain-containing protein [Thetidibacter halocola]|uniref:DUF1326 domain-containing protein n=1 Tax=Thetidibacter halocola TaxID=2827239 RepID=A0A8J7W8X6_9RHOB|nr:DUF1326 domain-containing protein [Thetidibacter halocola]MBS0123065.1 DUF1326 domain-containing protein [Thetidibacter halocola]
MGLERKPDADRLPVSQRIDQRMPNPKRRQMRPTDWAIKGELFLNCSCTVFCPCVVSLGKHDPTDGTCKAWMAIAIDEGHYENHDLTGVNVGLMVEIPGKMAEGDWRVAVYIDDSATPGAYNGLLKILSGEAGGTTGLFTMLVSTIIGHEREKVEIVRDGRKRGLYIGRKIQGEIEMIGGASKDHPVMVSNTKYWMGPDVIVAQAGKSKVRDYGRVWDLSGKSGEICAIDWKGAAG